MINEQTEAYVEVSTALTSIGEALAQTAKAATRQQRGSFEGQKINRARRWLFAARYALNTARDQQVLL